MSSTSAAPQAGGAGGKKDEDCEYSSQDKLEGRRTSNANDAGRKLRRMNDNPFPAPCAPSDATLRRPVAMEWDMTVPKERKVDSALGEPLLNADVGAIIKEDYMPGKDVFGLIDILSKAECAKIIDAAECFGFGRTNYPKGYRGNLRLICTDKSLATELWKRIQHLLPQEVQESGSAWKVSGLNSCIRFSKYGPGDVFEDHVDTCFRQHDCMKSMYTVNMYLNEAGVDFSGGATRFVKGRFGTVECRVPPKAGAALLFRQPPHEEYWHNGERVGDNVGSGVKYLLRTDVMYEKVEEEEGEFSFY